MVLHLRYKKWEEIHWWYDSLHRPSSPKCGLALGPYIAYPVLASMCNHSGSGYLRGLPGDRIGMT